MLLFTGELEIGGGEAMLGAAEEGGEAVVAATGMNDPALGLKTKGLAFTLRADMLPSARGRVEGGDRVAMLLSRRQ
jgi:hypothetical protein